MIWKVHMKGIILSAMWQVADKYLPGKISCGLMDYGGLLHNSRYGLFDVSQCVYAVS